MKEIGGYFEIENLVESSSEYHSDAIHLNLGRNSLVYLIKAKEIKKVFLPYYLCESVENAIRPLKICIEKYHISKKFLPLLNKNQIKANEYVYIVNYFGLLSTEQIMKLKHRYKNIILDNTHAFFMKPFSEDNTIDMFCTCRKYFGVPDGAYLYTNATKQLSLFKDSSKDRFEHLLGRKKDGAQKHYQGYVSSEKRLDCQGLKLMSSETENIMKHINYLDVVSRRNKNYLYLRQSLANYNILKVKKIDGAFCYPLLISNGAETRKALIDKNIYIPKLWPNLSNLNDFELNCVENLLPIPCDQRYDIEDMKRIVKEIHKNIAEIHIREISIADVITINRWHNDKDLYSSLVGEFYGPTLEETKQWINSYLKHLDSTFRGIVSNEYGKDIGVVYLIDRGIGKSEVGIFIANKKDRGIGYGDKMLSWLTKFGFEVLKLSSIYLYVLEENKIAMELYKKEGFAEEKDAKKTILKNKKAKNVVCLSLSKRDYGKSKD